MRYLAADKYCTMSEAAEMLGVSRQRMHELAKTYGAELSTLDRPRLHLISSKELNKIPVRRVQGKKSSVPNPKAERQLRTNPLSAVKKSG